MPKHKQPSKEELKEKIESVTKIPEEELEVTPQEEPEEVVPKEPEETVEETPEVEEKPAPPEPPKEDYKKKFSESSREAQKLQAKNRVLNKAIIDTDEIPDPTDEELQTEFRDWDVMSDVEKTLAKETVISKNWRARIKEAQDQAKKIEKWNESVETFVEDPKTLIDNPELEGKTDEFRAFAMDESNNNVPFKVLVGAFLHEQSKGKTPNKGRMFENGTGGPNDKPQPKSDKITLEESRKLRETDYNKWKEYLNAGRIESDL